MLPKSLSGTAKDSVFPGVNIVLIRGHLIVTVLSCCSVAGCNAVVVGLPLTPNLAAVAVVVMFVMAATVVPSKRTSRRTH